MVDSSSLRRNKHCYFKVIYLTKQPISNVAGFTSISRVIFVRNFVSTPAYNPKVELILLSNLAPIPNSRMRGNFSDASAPKFKYKPVPAPISTKVPYTP